MNIGNLIKYHVKYNKFVRLISKPYMLIKARRLLKEYIGSEYSLKMKKFNNMFFGQRCFIIGNGPSLSTEDLEKIKNEKSFAANRIYEIFGKTDWRPDFYVATDGNFINENYETIISCGADPYFLEYKAIRKRPVSDSIIGLCRSADFAINRWDDKTIHISEDLSRCFSDGYTVTFTSIQLAIYMGFKEIYLLGVDFNYSVVRDKNGKIHRDSSVQDYFNGKSYASTFQNYNSTLRAYEVAKKYCDAHDIKIYNATRGGKLEIFERVDLDTLFSNKEEEN